MINSCGQCEKTVSACRSRGRCSGGEKKGLQSLVRVPEGERAIGGLCKAWEKFVGFLLKLRIVGQGENARGKGK